MESSAMKAAAAASTASYPSFAEATRAVLDLLERQLSGATPYLAHLDRVQDLHRVVDARRGLAFGLRSNQVSPLRDSLDAVMADGRGPARSGDVAREGAYARLGAQARLRIGSYVAAPLELTDGTRVGVLGAIARERRRFSAEDEQLLGMLARVLAFELERESAARDARRLNESMRSQAAGLEALGELADALAGGGDARPAVCRAACRVTGAGSAFLLEPSGREFVSTAMHGAEMGPITIQPRGATTGRAFQATSSYFVEDATDHPALAAPLVEATGARSALFEPVLRDGAVTAVLILIWRTAVSDLGQPAKRTLALVAAQGAAAIAQAALRERVDRLAITDPLTGVPTRRSWDEELPRELARARRADHPVTVAALEIDHLSAFSMLRGEGESDRLLKEATALWSRQLREVDTLARLSGDQFGVILPSCPAAEAVDVLDRIRAVTPRAQTASAGVATWDAEEPAELLLARAQEALAGAKGRGGDQVASAD